MQSIIEQIGFTALVAVVKIDQAAAAPPLAQALLAGGMPVIEITFRTPAAAEAIKRIAAEVPGVALGAGTVLNVAQAQAAVAAGAQFLVSPGFSRAIVEWAAEQDVPVLPGVATPSEIMQALEHNLNLLKFFPAEELGGAAMLKALAGPFSEVRFIPTGGISAASLSAYLQLPNVFAVGGSWMVPANLIAARNFAEITQLAATARAIAQQIRA